MLAHLLEPPSQVREGVSARNIIHQKGSSRAAIVRSRNAFKGLLACSVPDLQLNVFFVDLNRASSELHANCEVMLLAESFVSELQQKTRFSHS